MVWRPPGQKASFILLFVALNTGTRQSIIINKNFYGYEILQWTFLMQTVSLALCAKTNGESFFSSFSKILCSSITANLVVCLCRQEASLFLFEKRIADKLHKPKRREIVTDILRRDVTNLQRLKHPKILRVLHSLEECK